jgi:hypothetical protein
MIQYRENFAQRKLSNHLKCMIPSDWDEKTCWECTHLNSFCWMHQFEIFGLWYLRSYPALRWVRRQCTSEWIVCGGANDRDSGLLKLITNCRHTHSLTLWLCELSHTHSIFDQAPCRLAERVSGGVTKDGKRENFISICTPACFVCLISSCTRVPIVSHWGIVQSKQHLRTWDAAF